jgi:hypothetical protein
LTQREIWDCETPYFLAASTWEIPAMCLLVRLLGLRR